MSGFDGEGFKWESLRKDDLRAVWQGRHQQLLCLSLLYSDRFPKQTECFNPPSSHCGGKRDQCLWECITKQLSQYFCSHSYTLTKVKQGMCVKAPGDLQRETDQPASPCILFSSFTSYTLPYRVSKDNIINVRVLFAC